MSLTKSGAPPPLEMTPARCAAIMRAILEESKCYPYEAGISDGGEKALEWAASIFEQYETPMEDRVGEAYQNLGGLIGACSEGSRPIVLEACAILSNLMLQRAMFRGALQEKQARIDELEDLRARGTYPLRLE